MGTVRRRYMDEFKREALGLLASSGRPLSQIAGELRRGFGAENARLRRENERLRMEREILKKRFESSRSHRNEIPHHRGPARDVPGSRLVRCHGRLSSGVLCLAWPAREPAQGGQLRPVGRDPAPPRRASRPLWRAQNPRGPAPPGAQGEPWPHRAPYAPPRRKGRNAAAVPGTRIRSFR